MGEFLADTCDAQDRLAGVDAELPALRAADGL